MDSNNPPPTSTLGRVAVIGAGLTGILVAHELSEAGFEVVLIDKGHIGHGSSSRSAACIRTQFSTQGNISAMLYAVRYYEQFTEKAECTDQPLIQNGYLYPFWRWHQVQWEIAQEQFEVMRDCGLQEVELLSPQESLDQFPFLLDDNLVGTRFCHLDGFLRPDIIMQEMVNHCKEKHGLVTHFHSEVTEFETQNGQITAVVIRKKDGQEEQVKADLFINCTNIWANQIAAMLKSDLPLVEPHKRYLAFVRRGNIVDPEKFSRWPMTVLPSGAYCHPEGSDQLMMGWAHNSIPHSDFTDEDQDTIEPGFKADGGMVGYPRAMKAEFDTYLPPVMEMKKISAVTCGYYAVTPDAKPVIDFDPQHSNMVHAFGFSGHGAMFAPATALVVRKLLQPTTVISFPITEFRINRDFSHSEQNVI